MTHLYQSPFKRNHHRKFGINASDASVNLRFGKGPKLQNCLLQGTLLVEERVLLPTRKHPPLLRARMVVLQRVQEKSLLPHGKGGEHPLPARGMVATSPPSSILHGWGRFSPPSIHGRKPPSCLTSVVDSTRVKTTTNVRRRTDVELTRIP